ncbi:glucose-6-phosphate 1-dehydrogenase [Striga asiatica]|uniref:Glucose-6-phosphate 1-dehydrogenase n=1 Tax=Striga asiatica TaxID=4170 RepID=A0A5A7RIF0_STRAF|nr:glucose-6-phosphate 1-dehydrogenase [Striga asiatica]
MARQGNWLWHGVAPKRRALSARGTRVTMLTFLQIIICEVEGNLKELILDESISYDGETAERDGYGLKTGSSVFATYAVLARCLLVDATLLDDVGLVFEFVTKLFHADLEADEPRYLFVSVIFVWGVKQLGCEILRSQLHEMIWRKSV